MIPRLLRRVFRVTNIEFGPNRSVAKVFAAIVVDIEIEIDLFLVAFVLHPDKVLDQKSRDAYRVTRAPIVMRIATTAHIVEYPARSMIHPVTNGPENTPM